MTTISGITGVNLTAGGSYFLYITPAAGDTFDAWNLVSTNGTLLSSLTGRQSNVQLSAFDVLGSSVTATPLPSAWTMLIAGFVGLGFFAYRGSKKNTAAIASA